MTRKGFFSVATHCALALAMMAATALLACSSEGGGRETKATFKAEPTSGTAPLEVQFTDLSDGGITSWKWDFNDDGTVDSTNQNPSHVFSDPGDYDVTLEVTGPEGSDTETKSRYIEVSTSSADATQPVISNIGVSAIAQTSATVAWTTDEKATSLVEYGTTSSYGTSSVLDSSLVTSHSVALTGLTVDTTYHFRVKSSDSSGNQAASGDATFDTSPSTSPTPALPAFTFSNEITSTEDQYDGNGVLIGASASGTIELSDGLGHICSGTVTTTFSIIKGKAKPLRKTILVPYDYGDTSGFGSALEPVPILSPLEFVTDYQHDENGVLLGGTTYVTFENVGAAGDVTAICKVSTTTCEVIFHMGQGESVKVVAHLPSTALSGYSVKYINWECRAALASDAAQGQVDVVRL